MGRLQSNAKGHGKGEPIKVPYALQKIFHGALEYDTYSNQWLPEYQLGCPTSKLRKNCYLSCPFYLVPLGMDPIEGTYSRPHASEFLNSLIFLFPRIDHPKKSMNNSFVRNAP